jgi:hypothetical protein
MFGPPNSVYLFFLVIAVSNIFNSLCEMVIKADISIYSSDKDIRRREKEEKEQD